MAFDWASQKTHYAKELKIKSMGDPGNNAPHSTKITTDNTEITYVDVAGLMGAIAENVLPSETTVTKSVAGGEDNAYILPWGVGYAAKTQLGAAQTRFVTPNLNGCAVFIAGGRASPTIIHANCDSDAAAVGEPEFSMDPGFGAKLNRWYMEYRLPVWSSVYITVLSRLVSLGHIDDNNLMTLLPEHYLEPAVSHAAVFGVREGGNWSFFINVNKSTRQIWPE